jgi:HEPN domain-containing protein
LSTELLIASHLRLANESLKAAQSLLRDGNRNAVYNTEQAVEMIVLALAQSETIHFPRAQQHQLDTMVRGLPAVNAFVADLSDLTWLEAYATAFRYPRTKGGISDPPRTDQLEDALTKTASLLKRVADHFGIVDLSTSAKSPAAHSKPPRKN